MSTKQATVVPPSTSQSTGLINNNDDMDTLLFGTTPSSLFDTISTLIDEQLTAEVSQLPLLPKKKSCHDNNNHNHDNMIESGEEILMRSLRKVYKKNLDVTEAYCKRNVFTLSSFDKNKRRKVLDRYFMMTDGHDKLDGDDGNNNNNEQQQQQQHYSKYKPPSKHETSLPTPNQIIQMDTEILKSRHCLQEEKIRGHALSTQISRLEKALHSLSLVRTALCHNSNNDDDDDADSTNDFSVLANKLQNAIDGHTEIKGWNEKAETVIRLLDKIKAERVERGVDGAVAGGGTAAVCRDNQATALTVCRDKDEKERRRVWEEMNGEKVSSSSAAGGSGSQQQQPQGVGSSQEIATLLKKLREK